MRMRKKSLADYGISREDGKKLYKRCKSENLSDSDRDALITAALETCEPVIGVLIIKSLTEDKSYDAISMETYIPLGRDDFYGYRRKTLARFHDILEENNEL